MEDYVDLAIGQAEAWDSARDRSKQRTVGWSNVADCRAYIGFELNKEWETNNVEAWPAIKGTVLHGWMTDLRKQAVKDADEDAEFDVELEYRGIVGHADEVNYTRGEIIDWKFPKLSSSRLWDDESVQIERFAQPQGYAAGIVGSDLWRRLAPSRTEATCTVLVCPVDGKFSDWRSYSQPFNIQIADFWADRLDRTVAAHAAGEYLPRDKPWYFCKDWCKFFDLCRGPDSRGPVLDMPAVTDEETAAAIERYGLASEAYHQADRTRKELAPMLRDLRGTARGWQIKTGKNHKDGKELDLAEVQRLLLLQGITELPMKIKPGRGGNLYVERVAP